MHFLIFELQTNYGIEVGLSFPRIFKIFNPVLNKSHPNISFLTNNFFSKTKTNVMRVKKWKICCTFIEKNVLIQIERSKKNHFFGLLFNTELCMLNNVYKFYLFNIKKKFVMLNFYLLLVRFVIPLFPLINRNIAQRPENSS